MASIFKDIFDREIMREKISENIEVLSQNNMFKKFFNFVTDKKIFVKICSLCLIGIISVVISLVTTGVTFGIKVLYAGAEIATIKDASVYTDAKDIAVRTIASSNADKAIKKPEFNITLTVSNRFDNAVKVANAIIENTDEVVSASALKVNGQVIACVEYNELEDCLETSRNRFNIAGAHNISSFVDKVEVENGYYLKSDTKSIDTVKSMIESLPVKTVSVINTDIEIPFESQTVKTNEEIIGYSQVTTPGENGISRKTETIEAINGVESSRNEVLNVAIKEPVTEITTIGTAKSAATATERKRANGAGFVAPLNKGSYRVSAYYGDGRNHKGVDLAADSGTSIFAVADGTVTYAGFDGDYGYSVIINHGNGLTTRYAHASTLCVNKGDKVSQGDLIALVGRTGYATGNHLHFEVMVNGSNVDPAPYIGIG